MKRDLTGESFGCWAVLGPSSRARYWDCRCSCGTTRAVFGPSLTRGASPSCGCVSRKAFAGMWTSHGHARAGARTREYRTWCNMIARCERPSCFMYRNYGGRGIYVCDRWRGSFDAFLRDVGYCPGPRYSIDRIDVNGSYTCGGCAECAKRGVGFNVRWATDKEQANNRRSNNFVEHDGKRLTIAQWGELLGIRPQLISLRLRQGMPPAKALSTTMLPRGPKPHAEAN